MSIVKRDIHKEGWEKSDFPIVCETCLGDNPLVRMTKAEFDKECKVCARPFTVFRWRPGAKARYKKTEVCQTCSKLKNVCQVCLLDLEYGLPVQVRDTAMPHAEQIPLSDVNREYFADQAERRVEQGLVSYGKSLPNPTLIKLARVKPYYKRNQAHVCSFFVRGECNRGSDCPYRHELPEEGELSQQNIKDRYYGVNDPVAKKLLGRAEQFKSIVPPDDKDITTLYVGGITPAITENDLRDLFYAYGEIKSIKLVSRAQCAFITYTSRDGAESAVENLYNKLSIKGATLRLSWGKPQQFEPGQYQTVAETFSTPPGILPQLGVPPPPGISGRYYTPPGAKPYYPSMDPSFMGSRPDTLEEKPRDENRSVSSDS